MRALKDKKRDLCVNWSIWVAWCVYVFGPIIVHVSGFRHITDLWECVVISVIAIAALSIKILVDDYATGNSTLVDQGFRLCWIAVAGFLTLAGTQYLSDVPLIDVNAILRPRYPTPPTQREQSVVAIEVGTIVSFVFILWAVRNSKRARELTGQVPIIPNLINIFLGVVLFSAYIIAIVSRTL